MRQDKKKERKNELKLTMEYQVESTMIFFVQYIFEIKPQDAGNKFCMFKFDMDIDSIIISSIVLNIRNGNSSTVSWETVRELTVNS